MDATLKIKLNPLVANTGFILTRPLKSSSVKTKGGEGFKYIGNAMSLEAVEVLVGNGIVKEGPRVCSGDLAYIRTDKYTQPWAKERVTIPEIEETVDGKLVPVQFIVVPIAEVVMFACFTPEFYLIPGDTIIPNTPYVPIQPEPYWPPLFPPVYTDPSITWAGTGGPGAVDVKTSVG